MRKCNWKRLLRIVMWISAIGLLVYSRFVNLGWGLPFPMHPDERNMAIAVQSLNCNLSNLQTFKPSNCLNPHFFAYGQFPLYVSYIGIDIYHFIINAVGQPIGFIEATMALRTISAIAAVLTVFIMLMIVRLFLHHNEDRRYYRPYTLLSLLIIIFSPALIQFAHFGTTESLLMFFYSAILYVSLLFLKGRLKIRHFVIAISVCAGLALGTKVSSAVFILTPLVAILFRKKKTKPLNIPIIMTALFFGAGFIFLISSPQNFISFNEFVSSISYESNVATGMAKVFYSRQFNYALPVLFQFKDMFPYAVGMPVLILFVFGFAFLPWKKPDIDLLRFAWGSYFVSQAFLYTKWTRFMAPTFPLIVIIAVLFLVKMHDWVVHLMYRMRSKFGTKNAKWQFKTQKDQICIKFFVFLLLTLVSIIPGVAYISVYQNQDVRLQASAWIYTHIPAGSMILSETANVVDLPLPQLQSSAIAYPVYNVVSFNFYDLDRSPELQSQLAYDLKFADYIIVPSRRIFANHTCEQEGRVPSFDFEALISRKCTTVQSEYPLLSKYYRSLFNGSLGFKKVAEFTSYPKLTVLGNTLIQFPDEQAEETWTVFDHPVIRIYQRMR